jgi:hypothetical protein
MNLPGTVVWAVRRISPLCALSFVVCPFFFSALYSFSLVPLAYFVNLFSFVSFAAFLLLYLSGFVFRKLSACPMYLEF